MKHVEDLNTDDLCIWQITDEHNNTYEVHFAVDIEEIRPRSISSDRLTYDCGSSINKVYVDIVYLVGEEYELEEIKPNIDFMRELESYISSNYES